MKDIKVLIFITRQVQILSSIKIVTFCTTVLLSLSLFDSKGGEKREDSICIKKAANCNL